MLSYRTTPGIHNLKLLTLQNRPVRLLGWSTDRETGVTYEALGINGAQASVFFRWKDTMISSYLKQRDPGLDRAGLWLANEASDPATGPEAATRPCSPSVAQAPARRLSRGFHPGARSLPTEWSARAPESFRFSASIS